MSDPEIVIVGAGAAGLAAASVLRRAGRQVALLEADRRTGGRARTSTPASLGGAPIDEGATWLHAVARNPLLDLARAAGETLHVAHQGSRRLMIGGRVASDADERAYGEAEQGWRDVAGRYADAPDRPLSEAGDAWDAANPWLGNVEGWEGAIIAAADADSLSLHDWHRNALPDGDLRPDCGMGTLVARHLAPSAGPVRCGVAVTSVDWSRPGMVSVGSTAGALRCRACIVTVSTGVLRDGRIAFTPSLPDDILTALDGLPMGLLSKLALLPSGGVDRARRHPGIGGETMIEQRLGGRGDPMMLLGAWPDGAPYFTGFLGGRYAWSFAGREADALDDLRARLVAALGPSSAALAGPGGFASDWGGNPLFLGAYAYARPGHADARGRLGRPFADGRLVLAGEACRTDGLAGTVGGAMHDGRRAAHAVLRALDGPGSAHR